MKTLLVLRHAKAEDADAGQLDFDRKLTKRGKRDAMQVGIQLREMNLVPHVVVTSAAKRTRKTAKRVVEAGAFQCPVTETDDLYDAGWQQILEVAHQLPPEAEIALLVGHNPGLSDFASLFGQQSTVFSKSTIAQLQLPIDSWTDLTETLPGEIVWKWTPPRDEQDPDE